MNTTSADAGRRSRSGVARIGVHLLLAALPLLAISAHVFGLVTMDLSAALVVLPLAVAVVVLSVFSPQTEDRVILHGFIWGVIACAVYDAFRLDTVYMLGWWADFIPTMGTWITGTPEDKTAGAIVGYLWRYIGDGGGIGIAFFVSASVLGLHRRRARTIVFSAIAFAVFPVWAGLIATVALAPRGQQMMFPLTPTTLVLSLIGHLIFGLILGLGFHRSRAVQASWPWLPFGRPTTEDVDDEVAPASRTSVGPAPLSRTSAALPPGHPSGPFPAGHPSGPFPAGRPSGPLPASGHLGSGSTPAPVGAADHTGPMVAIRGGAPRSGSQPVVTAAATGSTPAARTTASTPAARTTGSTPIASTRTGSARTGSTPTAGTTGSTPIASTRTGSARTGSTPAASTTGSTPAATTTGSQRLTGVQRAVARTAGRRPRRSDDAVVPAPRAAHTPPSGQTLDPETWEQWQRQLATTVRGRRTHRWR